MLTTTATLLSAHLLIYNLNGNAPRPFPLSFQLAKASNDKVSHIYVYCSTPYCTRASHSDLSTFIHTRTCRNWNATTKGCFTGTKYSYFFSVLSYIVVLVEEVKWATEEQVVASRPHTKRPYGHSHSQHCCTHTYPRATLISNLLRS